jgi:hypothetical protein
MQVSTVQSGPTNQVILAVEGLEAKPPRNDHPSNPIMVRQWRPGATSKPKNPTAVAAAMQLLADAGKIRVQKDSAGRSKINQEDYDHWLARLTV